MNASERDLLEVLADQLRIVTPEQIARAWFAQQVNAMRSTTRLVRRLSENDWLRMRRVLARPVSRLLGPLLSWRHGQPTPDLASLSRRLHHRSRCAAHLAIVVEATTRTRALFGTSGFRPRLKLTQTSHDLHVAEIFFRYRESRWDVRRFWVSEDRLPMTWPIRQRPDAILVDDAGDVHRALEYGGDYSVERLSALHDGLASIPLPYEIW